MERKETSTILVLTLGLMVWTMGISGAAPIGTEFTYQGRLIDDNVAADGEYDFQFRLFDGDTGGGRSSSGPYVLMGTIGQPDAAYSQGGRYELLGGFWPGGPLCFVDFEHFARFAELWLVTGSDLPADLYKDEHNIVNELDLQVFVDYWLCYCPTGWPLK